MGKLVLKTELISHIKLEYFPLHRSTTPTRQPAPHYRVSGAARERGVSAPPAAEVQAF